MALGFKQCKVLTQYLSYHQVMPYTYYRVWIKVVFQVQLPFVKDLRHTSFVDLETIGQPLYSSTSVSLSFAI